MQTNATAILIFANSGQQEGFKKPFKSSALVFDELNNHTIEKVKATGIPYFHLSEKEQFGNSFAERFTNAIQTVYAKGFDTVISIGNDTPHLKKRQLLEAAKQLETKDIVLGPSLDGGFYLMGLKKSHFKAEIFLKLPWQTSGLSQSIYSLIKANGISLFKLESLSDIDTISDIKLLVDGFKSISTKIKSLLIQIISIKKILISELALSYFRFKISLQFNKGSPICD